MTDLSRRKVLLASLFVPAVGRAQSWPARPMRLIVPFAAGAGVLDIMARLIAPSISEKLGQQIVVDNRPGAGGNVGAEAAAHSPADGHTLLIANTAMVVSPFLYARPGFDPLTSFVPVVMINTAPLMLVVHPSLPVRSLGELIAYARANPGKLTYGSGGVGSTPFLAVELLKAQAGFDAVHVPYKGGAPALADLVVGQISMMIENVPGTLPFVKEGRLRALAITSARRSSLVPDLPTIQEAGAPGYEMVGWNGLFLPAGTPEEIVGKLHDVTAAVLATPQARAQLAKLGADAGNASQAEFSAFVKAENARWGRIIRDKGIKPE